MHKDQVRVAIADLVYKNIGTNQEIDYDAVLLDNGLNSLRIVELILDIEQQFDFEFEDTCMTYETLRSINSITKYVYEHIMKNDGCKYI